MIANSEILLSLHHKDIPPSCRTLSYCFVSLLRILFFILFLSIWFKLLNVAFSMLYFYDDLWSGVEGSFLLEEYLFVAYFHSSFPGGSEGKASASPTLAGDPVQSLHQGKIPRRREWQPTPVLLPGKSHWWRGLAGYSPCGHKESNTTEQLHFSIHAIWKF